MDFFVILLKDDRKSFHNQIQTVFMMDLECFDFNIFNYLAEKDKNSLTFSEFRENCNYKDGFSYKLLESMIDRNILEISDSFIILKDLGKFILDEFKNYIDDKNSGELLKNRLDKKLANSPLKTTQHRFDNKAKISNSEIQITLKLIGIFITMVSKLYPEVIHSGDTVNKYIKNDFTFTITVHNEPQEPDVNIVISSNDEKINKKFTSSNLDELITQLELAFDYILEFSVVKFKTA